MMENVIVFANGRHISEDELEQYCLGRIDGAHSSQIEQHLLSCPDCLGRAQDETHYTTAIRQALADPDCARPQTATEDEIPLRSRNVVIR